MSKQLGDPFLLRSRQKKGEAGQPPKRKPKPIKRPERTFRDPKIIGILDD